MRNLDLRDEDKDKVSTAIVNGELYAILVLLLASQERIEALRVASTKLRLNGLVDAFDLAGPYFSKFTMLDLKVIDESLEIKFFRLWEILYLFYLPCLQNFMITRCVGDTSDLSGLGLSPGTIRISSISLINSCLNQETLEGLLDACKCVKSFTYLSFLDLVEGFESVPVDGDEIMQALQCQKKSNLINLHIELVDIYPEAEN